MKMSAARIRSMFKRYDSVHNEVFRFVPPPASASHAIRLTPVCAKAENALPSGQAVVDRVYRESMRRELNKAGLL